MPSQASPFEIKLTGSGSSIRPAERAILNLKAESLQTMTPAEASTQVAKAAATVRELITPYCPQENDTDAARAEAAISHYSMTTMDTTAQTYPARTSREGVTTEGWMAYSARAEFNIKFSNFGVLNQLATKLSSMDNITIKSITWHLKDATASSLRTGTRKRAAQDAIQRARDYAEVFCNLTEEEAIARVQPVSISENGYYSHSTRPRLHHGKGSRGVKVDQEDLQFEPEDVSVDVTVEARFQVN